MYARSFGTAKVSPIRGKQKPPEPDHRRAWCRGLCATAPDSPPLLTYEGVVTFRLTPEPPRPHDLQP